MEDFYREYLQWFKQKAIENAEPRSRGEMSDAMLFSYTLSETSEFVEDRCYLIAWVEPPESRSGQAEWFLFEETDRYTLEDGDPIELIESKYRVLLQ